MIHRRTDFLHAPKLGWRLSIYPLIVIPMMVYLNVAPQGEPAGHPYVSPSLDGEVRTPAVATPVQGVTGDGRAYVLERNPPWPLVRFEMRLAQPNTIIAERRGGM